MRKIYYLLAGFLACLSSYGTDDKGMSFESIKWSVYSDVAFPKGFNKQPGLTGTFSGLINDKLVIAGGANIIYDDQGKGAFKFSSDVYIISTADTKDIISIRGVLPEESAFGVSITLPEGLLIIGGLNERGASSNVYLLQIIENNKIEVIKWPSLPVALAFLTGTIIDNNIYIAGGQENSEKPFSGNYFLNIDSKNKDIGWKVLNTWPGPPRSFGISAGQNNGYDNCFYLFSGLNYSADTPVHFLSDGYEYNIRLKTWKKISSQYGPEFPVVGAVAFPSGTNHILFAGGIDEKLIQNFPCYAGTKDSISIYNGVFLESVMNPVNFSKHILFYHTVTGTIVKQGNVEFPVPLTANAVRKGEKIFIPSRDTEAGNVMSKIIVAEFLLNKTGIGLWSVLILSLYFGLLASMGWYFAKRQKNTNDFFKAGGKMSWWVVGLSIYGTTLSSITYMAVPAKTFATDWSYLIYNFGMILTVPVIILLFIPFYRKLNITTAYEYLEKRFNITVRVLASISYMIFQIGRIAIVLLLPAIAINIVTGFDIFLCIALMSLISLLYTAFGGIEAVIWTDAIQIIILLGGAIFALFFITSEINDGFFGAISIASENSKFNMADTHIDLKNPTLITVLIATFFANLTTYGTDQTVVQRYMTTPNKKDAIQSVWTKLLIALPGSVLFFLIGTFLFVYYKTHPSQLSFTINNGDAIFPWFIFTQMPPVISGILLSGILAAAMSTVSSSINAAATAYSVDIHFRFGWLKKVKELMIAKIASFFFGIMGTLLSFFMASRETVSLWDQFIEILGLLMGSFGGLFLLGMLTKRANGTGALVGIVTSVLVQIWIDQYHMVHGLLYVASGSISCFIVGYLVSLLTPKSKKDLTDLTI